MSQMCIFYLQNDNFPQGPLDLEFALSTTGVEKSFFQNTTGKVPYFPCQRVCIMKFYVFDVKLHHDVGYRKQTQEVIVRKYEMLRCRYSTYAPNHCSWVRILIRGVDFLFSQICWMDFSNPASSQSLRYKHCNIQFP